uniref:Uncharacterized protein n=1 Tax=viral metagenome TaxID=1070528 RepID=A0A6C0HSG1_9ZZZZ
MIEIFCLLALVFVAMLYKYDSIHDDNYSLVKKYLVRDVNISNGKPIIWIYIPTIPNSRKIKNFGDGVSRLINQEYLYLTIKSIIKNNPSFTICLIDNDSFNKLISGWEYDLNTTPSPILENMIKLAMSKILYIYGGIVVPLSFLCFKDLLPLYEHGTQTGLFICENINKSNSLAKYSPDPSFMGCRQNDPLMLEYSYFCETIISDTSQEPVFLGIHSKWFVNKNVTIINGEKIGIKSEGKMITIEKLFSTAQISLSKDVYGIYIPESEILQHHNYEWFSRLSKKEILSGDTILQKYIIMTCAKKNDWIPFWKFPY